MLPCVVIDTETTGLPWLAESGWRPMVIEVGAVSLDAAGAVVDDFEVRVRRPRVHLDDPHSAPAAALHQIPTTELLDDGRDPLHAGAALRAWVVAQRRRVGGGALSVTGWRYAFDLHFLAPAPFALLEAGLRPVEDLRGLACRVLGLEAPPSLDVLIAALRAEGLLPRLSCAALLASSSAHRFRRHRALFDAHLEGEVLRALLTLAARPRATRPRLALSGSPS